MIGIFTTLDGQRHWLKPAIGDFLYIACHKERGRFEIYSEKEAEDRTQDLGFKSISEALDSPDGVDCKICREKLRPYSLKENDLMSKLTEDTHTLNPLTWPYDLQKHDFVPPEGVDVASPRVGWVCPVCKVVRAPYVQSCCEVKDDSLRKRMKAING